jgi:hypothetical protein
LNNSGEVSNKEILDLLHTFGLMGSESEISDEKKSIDLAHAIFRIFDLNRNGSIDASEIENLAGQIFDSIFSLMTQTLKTLQIITTDEPLHQLVGKFCKYLVESGKQLPVTVEEITDLLNTGYESQNLIEVFKSIFLGPEFLFGETDFFHELLEIGDIALKEWEKFKSVINTISAKGSHPTMKACTEKGHDCFRSIIAAFSTLRTSIQQFALESIMQFISQQLVDLDDENPFKWIKFDEQKILKILQRVSREIHTFLDEKGIEEYLNAFFSLLEIKREGQPNIVSLAPLFALEELIAMSLSDEDNDNLKEKALQVQKTLFTMVSIIDDDGNKVLDNAELLLFAGKLINIAFDWLHVSLDMVIQIVRHSITTFVDLALDLKCQILGGSNTCLTHMDVCSVVLLDMIREERYEVLNFVTDLFAYTEENCNPAVFENLCSNIVSLCMFSPKARNDSKNFLRFG